MDGEVVNVFVKLTGQRGCMLSQFAKIHEPFNFQIRTTLTKLIFQSQSDHLQWLDEIEEVMSTLNKITQTFGNRMVHYRKFTLF